MEEVSGELFFLPIMLAYNHFLQNHPACIHCPGPGVGWGGVGGGMKGAKSSGFIWGPREVQRPGRCQAQAYSAPALNWVYMCVKIPTLGNLPSQIQFPQWQNENFHENICSILPSCEKPLKCTMTAYSLNPWAVLRSQEFLPSHHFWGKPKRSEKWKYPHQDWDPQSQGLCYPVSHCLFESEARTFASSSK